MWVTICLVGCGALLVTVLAALGISGHRKLDDALKSLGTAFKMD